MKATKLAIVAGLIVLGTLGSRHWEAGLAAVDRALGGGSAASTGGLDVQLELGFLGRHGWIEEGEDRKVYLLGSVKNPTSETVERLVLQALVRDAGVPGEPTRHEMILGPFPPGERVRYEEFVTYLLPVREDDLGNEVFEFRYDLEILGVE